jgi:chitinase
MRRRFLDRVTLPFFLLSSSLHAQWITGFYESHNGVEPVSSIPWSKYTHIVHFAVTPGIDRDGKASIILRRLGQSDLSEITQLVASRPSGKKLLLCIMDNGRDRNAFSQSTAPAMIGTFVHSIADFVNSHGYDGVDIDWEMNVDAKRYTQLLLQLRRALPTKVITADMGNGSGREGVASASQSYVDQFNIMCYDMDTPGNGFSWYNDALFQSGNSHVMTCDWRVKPFLKAGVAPAKISVGLPFYGRRWQGVTKALVNGNFSASTVLYNQLVADATRWQPQHRFYDSEFKSNYLSIPSMNEFDSYTGLEEIRDAASWIRTQGFGGAMTFSLHYEYLAGETGDARHPLSTALYDALSRSHDDGKRARLTISP